VEKRENTKTRKILKNNHRPIVKRIYTEEDEDSVLPQKNIVIVNKSFYLGDVVSFEESLPSEFNIPDPSVKILYVTTYYDNFYMLGDFKEFDTLLKSYEEDISNNP
jgi:hypothetical protein